MVSVKENAYAKINLYLDVLSKREDGFHDVKTVMHTVSLCDEVTVFAKRSSKRSVRLSVIGQYRLPTDSRNLAIKAAELFLDSTFICAEVDIRLVKRIPVAAGLAGGSSDAAAVLRALNRIFKRPLTQKRLLSLASELGSDVPFCLLGGTALCVGRGEMVERLPDKMHLHLVVASSEERVSTPLAYSCLDELYSDFKGERNDDSELSLASVVKAVNSGDIGDMTLFNIFENAIFKSCSAAERIKERMFDLGATHALMSGSGPSVYGIFPNMESAEAAKKTLIEHGINAYYAKTV